MFLVRPSMRWQILVIGKHLSNVQGVTLGKIDILPAVFDAIIMSSICGKFDSILLVKLYINK